LPTKILITGGSGIIGYQLFKKFSSEQNFTAFSTYNVHTFPEGHFLDIRNKESTEKLVSKIDPDIVIHSAALANVDLCEKNHDLADLLNVEGTKNIIQACIQLHYLHTVDFFLQFLQWFFPH